MVMEEQDEYTLNVKGLAPILFRIIPSLANRIFHSTQIGYRISKAEEMLRYLYSPFRNRNLRKHRGN